jgi:hypothetical protein
MCFHLAHLGQVQTPMKNYPLKVGLSHFEMPATFPASPAGVGARRAGVTDTRCRGGAALARLPKMVESTDFGSFAAQPHNPAETQPVTPGFCEQVAKGSDFESHPSGFQIRNCYERSVFGGREPGRRPPHLCVVWRD